MGELPDVAFEFPYALWRDLVSDDIARRPEHYGYWGFHAPYGVTSFRTCATRAFEFAARLQGFHTPYGVTSFRTLPWLTGL
jgi:hypothetical protein